MTSLDAASVVLAATDPEPAADPRGAGDDSWRLWVRFLRRRLVRLVISLWVLITFSFAIIHLVPGDPVRAALGLRASEAVVAAKRRQLGLDRSLWWQYRHFLDGLVHGHLGQSIQLQLPVSTVISQRLPATLQLAGLAFVVTIVVAFPVGVAMAVRTQRGRHRGSEMTFASGAVLLAAIPDFVLAVVLVALLATSAELLPVAGRSGASSFVIPVLALAVGPAAALSRIVRVETLGVLEQDFVRTAQAKRLRPSRVYLRHAVPNALTATLTVGGLLLSGLVAGTVLVENIVAWPGLGPTMTSSIINKDYPMVQGIVLVYGSLVLGINLVVDLLLALADPRSTIRSS